MSAMDKQDQGGEAGNPSGLLPDLVGTDMRDTQSRLQWWWQLVQRFGPPRECLIDWVQTIAGFGTVAVVLYAGYAYLAGLIEVVAVEQAGSVTAVHWSDRRTESVVETERGKFRVDGTASIFMGAPIEVEARRFGRRWLCQGQGSGRHCYAISK